MRSSRPTSSITRLFCFVSLAATLALAACGGDPAELGQEPGAEGALNTSVCAHFARAGAVEICHGAETGELSLTKVSQQACGAEHATHLDDFVASPQTGCKQAKPAGGGTCKPAGSACSFSRAAECCSLSCIFPVGAKKPFCG